MVLYNSFPISAIITKIQNIPKDDKSYWIIYIKPMIVVTTHNIKYLHNICFRKLIRLLTVELVFLWTNSKYGDAYKSRRSYYIGIKKSL